MQFARGDDSGRHGSGGSRRRGRTRENVVPLINVIFLLLVFFMLAGTLRAPSPLPVVLPESPAAAHAEAAPDAGTEGRDRERGARVAVLSAAGEVALDGSLLSPAELARALAGAALVELRADAAVPARILLPVLEALQQARVSQVDLVTRRAP